MLHGKRNQKIAFEIKTVIAEAIIQEMRDPRIGFLTVTDVDLSPDLRNAVVYISVFGEDKDKKKALRALTYARGFFQTAIAQKLQLRFTPKISFALDPSAEEGAKIDAIINKLHSERDTDGRESSDISEDQNTD